MNAQDYAAQVIAQHEADLDAARAKADKLKAHLAGAEQAVKDAEKALAAARAGDHVYVEPTEHVTVKPR